ncbi:UNVERIFIED_CONTAM: hypothetical protein NCL1_47002, partial [Trichonephila clavipes]
ATYHSRFTDGLLESRVRLAVSLLESRVRLAVSLLESRYCELFENASFDIIKFMGISKYC